MFVVSVDVMHGVSCTSRCDIWDCSFFSVHIPLDEEKMDRLPQTNYYEAHCKALNTLNLASV